MYESRLVNGYAYVFRVTAVNDAGEGASSDASARVTPLSALPAPPAAQSADLYSAQSPLAADLLSADTDACLLYTSSRPRYS